MYICVGVYIFTMILEENTLHFIIESLDLAVYLYFITSTIKHYDPGLPENI